MGNYTDKLKRYYTFDSKETISIVLGIVFCAFIFSFGSWGYTVSKDVNLDTTGKWMQVTQEDEETITVIDGKYGLKNLFMAILIATITILVHNSVQRMAAIGVGFKPEHLYSKWTMLAGFILTLLSGGILNFMAPIKMMLYHLPSQRVGEFKYGLNYWTLGFVGMLGPISAILLAIFFKILLYFNPENAILQSAVFFNLWFAGSNLLPIPPIDGNHMFFCSREFYIFSALSLFIIIILLAFLGVLFSLIIGAILSIGFFYLAFFHGGDEEHH